MIDDLYNMQDDGGIGSEAADEILRLRAEVETLRAALAQPADDTRQMCAEAYQAVGSMLSDLGQFDTYRARKLLDNLSACRLVHDDVLPWPAFAQEAQPASLSDAIQPDKITVNLMRLAGLDKHKARECEAIILQIIANIAQPSQPVQLTESEKHSFVRATMKHHGIDHHVHTALVADLIYGLEALAQPSQPADAEWRKAYSKIIKSLSEIVTVHTPDKLLDLDAIPRDPVMSCVTDIRAALNVYSAAIKETT